MQGSWVGALMPVAILLLRPFAYPVITLLLMGLNSFCSTYIGSVKWSLMSDCVDYGRWKTGKFAPGAYASIFSFLEKVMKSLSGAIVGFALGRAGFSEGAQAQGAIVLALIVFSSLPCPCSATLPRLSPCGFRDRCGNLPADESECTGGRAG